MNSKRSIILVIFHGGTCRRKIENKVEEDRVECFVVVLVCISSERKGFRTDTKSHVV